MGAKTLQPNSFSTSIELKTGKTTKKSIRKVESPIYSKLSSAEAISTKINILEMQKSLLEVMKKIESYKDLREKELMWKIKLKNNISDIKEDIGKIMREMPKTPKLKNLEIEHIEKKDNSIKRPSVGINIEAELMDIQRKLEEMNNK